MAVIYSDGLAVDSKGNIYLTGHYKGYLNGDENQGGSDCFLFKYSSEGGKIWESYWGTEKYDSADAIATDQSGNVYVAGHSSSVATYIKKFNSNGKILWTKEWNIQSSIYVYAIIVDSSGNIYVTGEADYKLDELYSNGDTDMFVTKWFANQL